MLNKPVSLAIIGDMHMQFDAFDVEFFNASDCDALLMVGDLASKNPDSMYRLLPQLNALTKPTYLIPGNHDTTGVRQLLGELMHNEMLINFGADSQVKRMERLRLELTHPALCGYSNHALTQGLGLVTARPFSMGSTNAAASAAMSAAGGEWLATAPVNFRPFLEKEHGVSTLAQSRDKIKSLIDEMNPPYLIMAHHGPYGLGTLATDMWGADFLPQETDFGDADLTEAVTYAQMIKKPPLAVVAGHMHYPTKHGKKAKQWYTKKDGILYINAARWPRIFKHEDRELHHHVRLTITENGTCDALACYVAGSEVFTTSDDRAMLPTT